MPKWVAALGFVNVTAGMLFGVFLVSAITGGRGAVFLDVASISGLLWFAIVGIHMSVQGEPPRS